MNATTPADKELLAYLEGVHTLREQHRRASGHLYSGVEDYLLKHGTFFTPRELPPTVQPMALSQCYDNAFRVAARTKALHYVEGVAICNLPLSHAWLIDRDGNVVDPTWTDRLGTAYCGVEINLTEVRQSRRGRCMKVLEDYKRRFPALVGVDVIAPDAWFLR